MLSRVARGGHFHPDADRSPDENFSIAIPPPNVTGELHMGHALNGTLQDVLTRTRPDAGAERSGRSALDHAGIATQVGGRARAARARGSPGRRLGREAFVKRVWEWRERYGSQIVEQYKRLGASCDYERERFTIDEALRARRVPRLRGPLRQGLHLPRQLHRQLGSRLALRDLRPRGGEPRGRGHALLHRLSPGGLRSEVT